MVKPGKTALSEARMGSQKRGHGLGTAAPISSLRVLLSYAGGRMGGHMDTGIFFPTVLKAGDVGPCLVSLFPKAGCQSI